MYSPHGRFRTGNAIEPQRHREVVGWPEVGTLARVRISASIGRALDLSSSPAVRFTSTC